MARCFNRRALQLMAIESLLRVRPSRPVVRLADWPHALAILAFLLPLSFLPLAAAHGGGLIVVPYQHFYIVSAVSILAALIGGAIAVAPVPIGLYRVLFLCLGFMSMGAFFAVHGLTTPGILVPNLFQRFIGSAVAISAYLSLAVPALFFAASYAPGLSRLERRAPALSARRGGGVLVCGLCD